MHYENPPPRKAKPPDQGRVSKPSKKLAVGEVVADADADAVIEAEGSGSGRSLYNAHICG